MANVTRRGLYVVRDNGSRFEPFDSMHVGTVAFPDVCAEPNPELAKALAVGIPDDGKEHVIALAMSAHGAPLAWQIVSTGSVDNCPLYSRDIFGWAVQVPGCRFVGIAHNHPSGVVTPSKPDILGTAGVVAAGKLLGLDLLWSLVVTHVSTDWAVVPLPSGKQPEMGNEDGGTDDEKDKGEPEPDEEPGEPGEPGEDTEPGDEPGEPEPEEGGVNYFPPETANPEDVTVAVGRLLGRIGRKVEVDSSNVFTCGNCGHKYSDRRPCPECGATRVVVPC